MKFTKVADYDNHNRPLTKEQDDFFKKSIVRDNNGRLLQCYHGTHYYGFSDFDAKGMDAGFNFFTPNYTYANVYAYEYDDDDSIGIYKVYLNITKPLFVGDVEKPIFKDDDKCYDIIKNNDNGYCNTNGVSRNEFTNEFIQIAVKVRMTPNKLFDSVKWIDDNVIYSITRKPEFADIILKLGYDGMVTGEYSGRATCYAVPYSLSYNIKSITNKTPTKSKYIDEERES